MGGSGEDRDNVRKGLWIWSGGVATEEKLDGPCIIGEGELDMTPFVI